MEMTKLEQNAIRIACMYMGYAQIQRHAITRETNRIRNEPEFSFRNENYVQRMWEISSRSVINRFFDEYNFCMTTLATNNYGLYLYICIYMIAKLFFRLKLFNDRLTSSHIFMKHYRLWIWFMQFRATFEQEMGRCARYKKAENIEFLVEFVLPKENIVYFSI